MHLYCSFFEDELGCLNIGWLLSLPHHVFFQKKKTVFSCLTILKFCAYITTYFSFLLTQYLFCNVLLIIPLLLKVIPVMVDNFTSFTNSISSPMNVSCNTHRKTLGTCDTQDNLYFQLQIYLSTAFLSFNHLSVPSNLAILDVYSSSNRNLLYSVKE